MALVRCEASLSLTSVTQAPQVGCVPFTWLMAQTPSLCWPQFLFNFFMFGCIILSKRNTFPQLNRCTSRHMGRRGKKINK